MTKHIISNYIIPLMLLIGAASCTGNADYGKILRHLPEDSDFVAVFNAEEIIRSSGGTVEKGNITFSDEFSRLFNDEQIGNFNKTVNFLNNADIYLKEMAVVYNYDHFVPTLIFGVDDMGKFKSALLEYGFVETDSRDDITILSKRVYESPDGRNYDRFDYIALNERSVYWKLDICISQSAKPLRVLTDIIESTHKSSFINSPYAKYLTGNLGAMTFSLPPRLRESIRQANIPASNIETLSNARICITGLMDNNDINLTAKCYDEKGREIKVSDYTKYVNPDASINKRPLSYLNKNENLIYAFTFEGMDWNEYFSQINNAGMLTPSQKFVATIVKSYLEQIDGTVALGIGLTDGFNSLSRINSGDNPLKELNLTLVVETDKAKSMVEDLKSLMNTGNIEFTETGNGFNFTIPDTPIQLTAQADGDILVISNREIKKSTNAVVNNFDFNDYNASIILSFPHTDTLMKDLYIDNDIELSFSSDFDESQLVANLSVSGDSEGIIAKLISIALSIESQKKALNERYTGRCKIE